MKGEPTLVIGEVDVLRGMDIAERDDDAIGKLAVFLVLSFVPIVGWLVLIGWLGYGVRRARGGATPELLPFVGDLGVLLDYALLGLKATGAGLVWSIPTLLLNGVVFACIWFSVLGAAFAGASTGDAVGAIAGSLISMALLLGMAFVGFVLNLILAVPRRVARLRVLLTGEFGSAFSVGEVLGLARARFGTWLLEIVLVGMLSILIVIVCSLLPVIGSYLGLLIATIVGEFSMLSVYERALVDGHPAIPLGPATPPPPS